MTAFARMVLSGVLVCAVSSTATAAFAAARRSAAQPLDQLGSVNFPTSCNAAADAKVKTGVALMHSFQYQQARVTFEQAASADPQCAIAHWGAALTHYHQLWENPDKDALDKGRAQLDIAHKLGGGNTALERGYITGADAYFRGDTNLTYEQRVQAFAGAMAKVHTANPNDVDASAFYALSLVSLAYKDDAHGDQHRQDALAILLPLFAANPDHPGVAHYIIHAADTPARAPQALEAARRYAKIAPDSSHALHMPAHTFTRLGLWQESIDSNIAAEAAAAKALAAHDAEAHYQFHAMDFLAYSYVQMGQGAEAQKVLDDLKNVKTDEHHIAMRAAYLDARNALDMRDWKKAAALPVPSGLGASDLVSIYWAKSIGTARTGDAAAAKENLEKMLPGLAARAEEDKANGEKVHEGKPVEQLEAEGWLAFAEGRADDAAASLRAAADRQEADGIDSVVIPAREMLAELYVETKQPDKALVEYRAVLKESPNRFNALYGAAIASNQVSDKGAARDYMVHLQHNCGTDADRPEIHQLSMMIDRRWPH
jgi:tetratricopeptide (TPR) repeat protein